MSVFDNITSTVNKGIVGANRATATMKLKAQLNDVLKRRQNLAAQLGASLYEATKEQEEFRTGREMLYDGIAACDKERMEYQAEIERIEHEVQTATAGAICPFCGSRMGVNDMFCSGCGKSISEIREVLMPAQVPTGMEEKAEGTRCQFCGALINEGDMFCMNCGKGLK